MVEQIGRYRIVALLGEGGMGKVYQAFDTQLQRTVAIKVLNETGCLAEQKTLVKEARTLAQLDHPNIVTIYEIAQEREQYYIVMEYVAGCSLAGHLAHKPSHPDWCLGKLHKIALAMYYAHRQNILHRDLKPANIMLAAGEEPKVMDFGLAKMLSTDSSVSSTGWMIGTPAYIPPEQVHGDPGKIDQRSDVYGLGAIFYEMLTGRPPFQGDNIVDLAVAVLKNPPTAPTAIAPSVPREVEAICLKCLEKNPKNRYQSAKALAQDIERYFARVPISIYRHRILYRIRKWRQRNCSVKKIARGLIFVLFLLSLSLNIYLLRRPAPFSRDTRPAPVFKMPRPDVPNPKTDRDEVTPAPMEVLPGDFVRTMAAMLRENAGYSEMEPRLLELQERIVPCHLLHRYWGQICLACANREERTVKYLELLQKAVDEFDRAIAIYPEDYLSCFLAYQTTQKISDSASWQKKAREYEGRLKEGPYSHYLEGCTVLQSAGPGENHEARAVKILELCDRALACDPQFTCAYALKVRAYLKCQLLDEAWKNCRISLESSRQQVAEPNSLPLPWHSELLCLSGDILYELGKFEDAIASYDQAIAEDINGCDSYLSRGQCHRKLGNCRQACLDFSRALAVGGKPAECYRKRGRAYLELGEYDLAMKDAGRLLRLLPQMSWAYELKARIYFAQQNYPRAREELGNALKYEPENPDLQKLKIFFHFQIPGDKSN